MPDNQDKKPQTSREQVSADQDIPQTSPTAVKATNAVQNKQDNVPNDRATQASQAAQSRRRDEGGRFATDDDREPQRSRARDRQDDYDRDRYAYDENLRSASSRRELDD